MVKRKLPPQSFSSLEAVEPHPKNVAIKGFFYEDKGTYKLTFLDVSNQSKFHNFF